MLKFKLRKMENEKNRNRVIAFKNGYREKKCKTYKLNAV